MSPAPDFPLGFDPAPSDDPAKGWRVMDASGNTTDYDNRYAARRAADDMRDSSAVYARKEWGEWWRYETLLREGLTADPVSPTTRED
jgi:hypothetical protein